MRLANTVTIMACVLVPGKIAADGVSLRDDCRGKAFRVTLTTKLKGTLTVVQAGQAKNLPHQADARHEFDERVLAIGADGMPLRCVRRYQTARITIETAGSRIERAVRETRRLLVVPRIGGRVEPYCPDGKVTREELDLLHHFDVGALTAALPTEKVEIGGAWKLSDRVAQALCSLDELTSQTLRGTLVAVEGDTAIVAITGHAGGIENGASVNLKIDATLQVNTKARYITRLAWTQEDTRDPGPINPKLQVSIQVEMERRLIDAAPELERAAEALPAALEPPAQLRLLEFVDPGQRYVLSMDRGWYPIASSKDRVVLRRLDGGSLTAQATLMPWPDAQPGSHVSAAAFKQAMAKLPDWKQQMVLDEHDLDAPAKHWLHRIVAEGKVQGIPAQRRFYLLAAPDGRQLAIVFTLDPGKAKAFGDRDRDLVGRIRFVDR